MDSLIITVMEIGCIMFNVPLGGIRKCSEFTFCLRIYLIGSAILLASDMAASGTNILMSNS